MVYMALAVRAMAGIRAALRARPGVFVVAALATAALSVLLPPAVLSLARKPVDYATLNPWLRRLPEYLAGDEHPPLVKAEKLWSLALFWFSADSPMGGTEWGFAVDTGDLARIALIAVLVGAYAALWRHARDRGLAGPALRRGGRGGVMGAVLGVLGLSTGPCSVMGCGAPVLPAVALAFAGLSSGTLAALAGLSRWGTPVLMAALAVAVLWLGARVGRLTTPPATPPLATGAPQTITR